MGRICAKWAVPDGPTVPNGPSACLPGRAGCLAAARGPVRHGTNSSRAQRAGPGRHVWPHIAGPQLFPPRPRCDLFFFSLSDPSDLHVGSLPAPHFFRQSVISISSLLHLKNNWFCRTSVKCFAHLFVPLRRTSSLHDFCTPVSFHWSSSPATITTPSPTTSPFSCSRLTHLSPLSCLPRASMGKLNGGGRRRIGRAWLPPRLPNSSFALASSPSKPFQQ